MRYQGCVDSIASRLTSGRSERSEGHRAGSSKEFSSGVQHLPRTLPPHSPDAPKAQGPPKISPPSPSRPPPPRPWARAARAPARAPGPRAGPRAWASGPGQRATARALGPGPRAPGSAPGPGAWAPALGPPGPRPWAAGPRGLPRGVGARNYVKVALGKLDQK